MVSIIIPAYNAERVIGRCIDSVVRQTYKNYELIVVDDGSTDETVKTIEEKSLANRQIKLIQQKNSGVSAARNKGIENSSGEFICFIDSDDSVSPDYLKVLVAAYAQGCLPVIDVKRSDKEGSALKQISKSYKLEANWEEEYFCGELGQKIAFSVWNKLFSAKIIKEKNIRFNEQLSVGEDMLFTYEYMRFCEELRFSNDAVYYYTIAEGSGINSNKDYLKQYENTLSEMKKSISTDCRLKEKIVSKWSFNAAVTIIANPYIANKTFDEFVIWWKTFSNTELFENAMKSKPAGGYKRKALYELMRLNKMKTLYIVLRVFQLKRIG